ncbi:MAG: FAD:protein FMN transferase [Gammaproteobacteria bacterium]|nr:FAD:protein FMN transferase [Gammaproteobacteria bacterium]
MRTSCSMTSVVRYAGLLLLSVVLVLLTACERTPEPVRFNGSTMGTTYHVTVPALPEGLDIETIQSRFDELLQNVNGEMSTYQPDSVISEFNRSESTDWFPVSPAFARVTQTALELSRLSDGAYDVTVAPLIELWGFGAKFPDSEAIPDDASIQQALARTGFEKVELQTQPFAIRKHSAKVTMDLSSIAKGYGVDVLAAYLESVGITDFLVEIGGELRAAGKSERGDAWRIAVEKPVAGERSVQRVIELRDVGIATSGDYRNYFEKDGKRYSHMIDAATGRPVTHRLASVTVLADTAMLADGWATTLMLLGEEKGYALAERRGLAAYFIYRQADAFEVRETEAFTRITGEHAS